MSTSPDSETPSSPAKDALPGVILDYITAANEGRIDDAAACFAQDALVHDENRDHSGRAAIRAWIARTTQEYQPRNEVLRAAAHQETLVVTSKISGSFPGSPVELKFSFVVSGGKIAQLSIQ